MTISVRGVDNVRRRLATLQSRLGELADPAATATAATITAIAPRLTGAYADSVTITEVKPLAYRTGPTVPYARKIELRHQTVARAATAAQAAAHRAATQAVTPLIRRAQS